MARSPPLPSLLEGNSSSISAEKSLEYRVFVKFYSKLTIVFRNKDYLPHLVTAGIVPPDNIHYLPSLSNRDRPMRILEYISDSLDGGDKQSFYEMLEIMKGHGNNHAQNLAEEINRAVVSGVDFGVTKMNSLGSVASTRSDSIASVRSDSLKSESIRSDSIGSTAMSIGEVSPVNTSSVNSIDFTDCENISTAFLLLTTEISKLLKRADFAGLRRALVQQRKTPGGVQFPDDLHQSIKAAKELDTLLDILADSDYWSWVDLRLLDTLIVSSGIKEAKILMQKYKDAIFPKKLSEILDKLPLPQPKEHREAYTTKVGTKIQKEPDDVTVGDLPHYCNILETVIMDINNGSCVLEHVDQGCLEIHWFIPTHCRLHAYKSALNNRHKFCEIHLQYLEIEPYPPIYDPFTIQPTMLSTLLHLPKPITSSEQGSYEADDSTSSLTSSTTGTKSTRVTNQEQCPFEDSNIVSNQFTFDGGVTDIKHCGLKVIVPKGAIEGHCVEIKVAVSLFGPFDIPNDFHPVSPYVWIATVSPADYVFKKQLQIEFQHHADVSNLNNISKLCVLKASCTTCGTHHPKMHKMHMTAWNCHFDVGDTVCTLFTNHFCSYCLASKSVQVPDRIIAYHYLPTNYELADTFRAEICFCYDLNVCKETIEKRYMQRNMFKSLNIPIRISLTREDELHMSDPHSVDGWNIVHLSTNKIGIGEIDFREWYKSPEDLEKDESRDIYPPRFITQLNCHRRCTLDLTYTLNLMKDRTIVKDYKFSIYVKGPASTTMDSVGFSQNEILQQEPKIGDLFEFVVPQIKAHWEDVAYTALRYDIPIVDGIQKKHLNDIKKCCQEMFKIWLTTPHGVEPKTWSTLLAQLKKVEELVTGTEVIEKALKNLQL